MRLLALDLMTFLTVMLSVVITSVAALRRGRLSTVDLPSKIACF